MGYTHYWKAPETMQSTWFKVFPQMEPWLRRVLEEYDEILDDEWTALRETFIQMNGLGDYAHEDLFVDHRGSKFSFCKTARKPYDVPVCLALMIISAYIPEFDLSSDGFSAWPAEMENGLLKDNHQWYEPCQVLQDWGFGVEVVVEGCRKVGRSSPNHIYDISLNITPPRAELSEEETAALEDPLFNVEQ